MTAPPRVRFDEDGIEICGGLLWLDAQRPKPLGVITHAHGDHVARHRKIVCTPETRALIEKRLGPGLDYTELAFREPFRVGDLTLTLLPAGHILGSAMVRLEGPGGSLLYTGDVRLEGGLTCPPAEPEPADLLVMEATFGRKDHRHPPPRQARAELVRFAQGALEEGETPVFLAYPLGKGQEVMAALAAAGVPVAAHGAIWNLCDVYRRFGFRFPGARRLSRGGARSSALVVPPYHAQSPEVQAAAPLRVAAVTGWGSRAGESYIQLSDHADYDGLLRLVDAVRPGLVHVLHGYATEFAEELRRRGHHARPVPGHSGPADGVRPGMFGD